MAPIAGTATQPDESLLGLEKKMVDATYKKVLQTLASHRSMPFLELTSLCDIGEDNLERIISDLENNDVVRVVNRGDVSEEIVTLRHKGFALASSLGY